MRAYTQSKRNTHARNALYLLLVLLPLLLLGSVVMYRSFSAQQTNSTRAFLLSVNGAMSTSGMSTNYDSRPCVHNPSAVTCNGVAPVTPKNVSPLVGARNGSGACINGLSRTLEEQPLQDGTGTTIGTLQLHYLPSCQSYYAFLTLTVPTVSITRVSVWIQTERYGWYEKVSQLPPFPTLTEKTGPFQGRALTTQDFYTPLIFSASDPVSAHTDLELVDGTSDGSFTSSYTSGVFQYSGVA